MSHTFETFEVIQGLTYVQGIYTHVEIKFRAYGMGICAAVHAKLVGEYPSIETVRVAIDSEGDYVKFNDGKVYFEGELIPCEPSLFAIP